MKLPRRRFLQLASSAALMPAAPYVARAQGGYPNHPVRIIVGQAAGSSSDIAARLMAQWLSEKLNGQFIVEVKPGATGNIATDFVAHAPADGYTLLLMNAQNTINATLYEKPGFDFMRDIVPVAGFNRVLLVMEVNPDFPAKTVPEFIAYAKANPGKVNMASAGAGGPQHAAGEMFKYLAGVDMVHVPYNGGGPALASILAGVTDIYGSPYATAKPFVDDGKLVGLAITSAQRIPYLPDVPTVAETLPGYDATTWYGLMVPADTPRAVRDRLQAAVREAVNLPETKRRFQDLGYVGITDTPEAFATFLHEDIAHMAQLIKQYNLKPE